MQSAGTIKTFVVDAFTKIRFKGNPAAVCLINEYQQDSCKDYYQQIAAELNLAETAFVRTLEKGKSHKDAKEFALQWFTPTMEIKLCGHATLAAAHVLSVELGNPNKCLLFQTLSGTLIVNIDGTDRYELVFPSFEVVQCHEQTELALQLAHATVGSIGWQALALVPESDLLLIVMDPQMDFASFTAVRPNFWDINEIIAKENSIIGILITLAPQNSLKQGFGQCDYVSRFFAPGYGVQEDPATGMSQCTLGPFWAKKLGIKKGQKMKAKQCFPGRGAEFEVLVDDDKTHIFGSAVTVLNGEFHI